MKYSDRQKRANHFLDKTGHLKPTSDKGAFWDVVDEMLIYIYTCWPQEMKDIEVDVAMEKHLSINDFHASIDKSQRMVGTIPSRLYALMYKYFDKLDATPYGSDHHKLWTHFWKRYPRFSYAKRV